MFHSHREWRQRTKPLTVYSAIWVISVILFWLTPISDDAIAYSLLVFYLLLPISTIVASFIMGQDQELGWKKGVVPVFFGVMYMLAEYCTFRLANMLSCKTISEPEYTMVLIGMAISLIAMGLGNVVQTYSRRRN